MWSEAYKHSSVLCATSYHFLTLSRCTLPSCSLLARSVVELEMPRLISPALTSSFTLQETSFYSASIGSVSTTSLSPHKETDWRCRQLANVKAMKRCAEVGSAFYSTHIFWERHKKRDKQEMIVASWEVAVADQDVPQRRSHQKGKDIDFTLSFPLLLIIFSSSSENTAIFWRIL